VAEKRPSPVPDIRPELDDEPKTDPRMLAAIEKHAPAHSKARDIAVAIAAVGTSVIVALIFVDNRVAAQTDAGVKVMQSRVTALEQQVPQLRQEVFQGRLDTQALYKAVMDGKRQERLEQPPAPPALAKDGGP
jgi:hypothetical protein